MSEKLSQLHQELAEKLLERVRDPKAKSSDLNVARQFLKDNGIDAIPVDNSPLKKLMEELPFNEKPIKVSTN
jgi:hypothetical protein|tara:strand:- start:332 stop:547 length:216 start_codon:yes stop_codon:yes gene_type:complete